METFQYPQFPPELATVCVALFTDLQNAPQLRKRLVAAATMSGQEGEDEREAVNFAFIDARLITSTLHLQTAIYHAILAATQNSLRTKTVHSEVLWTLNPSNNISEAFRRYGVADDTTAMLVVRIDGPIPDIQQRMHAVVQGKMVPLDTLGQITDWGKVKKTHKLNNEVAIRDAGGDVAQEHAIIDEIVTSSVAMKSVMA